MRLRRCCGRQRQRAVAAGPVEARERRHQRCCLADIVGGPGEQRLEPVQPALDAVVRGEARGMGELLDHRVERRVGVVGRALVAQQEVRLAGHRLDQSFGDPRLADPGLAGEQDHLPFAGLGLPPALDQQGQFLIAADDRRHAARLPGGEAALERALAEHDEGGGRFLDPLERLRAERAQHEQVAEQPAGRFGDHDRAGLGHALEAGGKVRRIADHRLLLGSTFADQVADDHEAGRDPDPGRQRLAGGDRQPADRGDHREPGPDRALGLVLVRPGPAEIGEHAIAHQLGGKAFEPADLARHGILIGPQHIAHLLGIEPSRERGRADQVDEHHGQLAALRRGRRDRGAGRRGGRSGARAERRDRLQQLLAMAERGDADFLQIIAGQPAQQSAVDVIGAEHFHILGQTDAAEPTVDVQVYSHGLLSAAAVSKGGLLAPTVISRVSCTNLGSPCGRRPPKSSIAAPLRDTKPI